MKNRNELICFLELLDRNSIPYVSWKNNHELDLVFEGLSDIDLYVPFEFMVRFKILALENKWVELKSQLGDYAYVTHWYKLIEEDKPLHLNVYFKIVTGESWLKEYILPIGDFLINQRVMNGGQKVWVLSNKAQAYLFLIRHFLKTGSVASRFLYKKETSSYRSEWLKCGISVVDLKGFGPISIDKNIEYSGLIDGFELPSMLKSILFRMSFYPYMRFGYFELFVRRIIQVVVRVKDKFYKRTKKRFVGPGYLVSLSGFDGSGKSTILERLQKTYAGFLDTEIYMLGKPEGEFVKLIKSATKFVFAGKNTDPYRLHSSEDKKNRLSILSCLKAVFLAVLRLRVAQNAVNSASCGKLVFTDRWPTDVSRMMDGPRIFLTDDCGKFKLFLSNIEKWIYKSIPKTDYCIFLNVPIDVALARNRARQKKDKETDEQLMIRHKKNQDFRALSSVFFVYDNIKNLDDAYLDIQNIVWSFISANDTELK